MILVTGGTGLVGSHLLYDLAKDGQNIRAIHRKNSDLRQVEKVFSYYCSPETASKFFKAIEWVEADINDIPALTSAFEDIDQVYHCAALISFDGDAEKHLRKTNIKGTANIVNLCISKRVNKLCHVSSIASLGRPLSNEPIDEETVWNPEENHSDYAISKYGAEIEIWRGSQEGLDVVIVNPGIIIGPGFWNSGSGQIFSRVNKGLSYYFPKITGFVGVWDVVKVMQLLMKSNITKEKFILVSENLSFKEVLDHVAISLNKPKPKKPLKKWMVFTGWVLQKAGSLFGLKRSISRDSVHSLFENSHYNNQKILKTINYRFTPVKEVIPKTAEYYKS